MLTELIFTGIAANPRVKIELPSLRLGEKLTLSCNLFLHKQGRTYQVELQRANYKVEEIHLETSKTGAKQVASVSVASGKEPTWKAVRGFSRPKPPKAKQPRTSVAD